MNDIVKIIVINTIPKNEKIISLNNDKPTSKTKNVPIIKCFISFLLNL